MIGDDQHGEARATTVDRSTGVAAIGNQYGLWRAIAAPGGVVAMAEPRWNADQTARIRRTPPARGRPRRHGHEPVRSEPGHRRGMAASARRPAPPGGPGASRARTGREPILAAASER